MWDFKQRKLNFRGSNVSISGYRNIIIFTNCSGTDGINGCMNIDVKLSNIINDNSDERHEIDR